MSNNTLEHIAIILDGNGRWAEKNGHTRNYGHKRGCDNLVKITKYARKRNIKYLSLFTFSTENWSRPKKEVNYLMSLIKAYLDKYLGDLKKNNVKVNILGRKDNLPYDILMLVNKCEEETKDNNGYYLNICFNYGSHEEIVQAVKRICADVKDNKVNIDKIDEQTFSKYLYTKDIPQVDLLIRTSGEQRISNFLLWQIAYSELYFTDVYWPDFSYDDLEKAIDSFNKRNRRFGGLK